MRNFADQAPGRHSHQDMQIKVRSETTEVPREAEERRFEVLPDHFWE